MTFLVSALPARRILLPCTVAAALALGTGKASAQLVDTTLWSTNNTVRAMVRQGHTLYIGGDFTLLGPAVGNGVPLNATTGALVGPFPKVAGIVHAVASDGSGGWYIGGHFTAVGRLPRNNLAHILANGSVAAWSPTPTPNINNDVGALAVIGGTVYAGGIFTIQAHNYVVALDGITGVAKAWNPNPSGPVYCLAASGNTLYAGGNFSLTSSGVTHNNIAALDATTGAAFTTWNPNPNGPVYALAVSGSTLYAGGYFTSFGSGSPRNNAAAVDATTGALTAWNPNTNDGVYALAVSGSRVFVGGNFSMLGGLSHPSLAAVDATTGADTGWNAQANGLVNALLVSGNTLYVVGDFQMMGGQARNNLAAVDATTGAATALNPAPDAAVRALAMNGSVIYAGGDFTILGGVTRNHLAALDLTTGAPTAWDPGTNGPVNALAISGNVLYVGGMFRTIAGQGHNFLAALDATTGAAMTWDTNTDGIIYSLAVDVGMVYAGGQYDQIGARQIASMARLDSTTGVAAAWGGQGATYVSQGPAHVGFLAAHNNRVYVGGDFDHVGDTFGPAFGAALDRVFSNTFLWAAWYVHGPVNTVVVNGSTIYFGGDFNRLSTDPPPRAYVAASDTIGNLNGWDPEANGPVHALVLVGNTVYAAGEFTTIGGQSRNYVAALDTTTGNATPWNPNVNGNVYAMLTDGSTKTYLGGSFYNVDGQPQSGLAAVYFAPLDVPTAAEAPALLLASPVPSPVRGRARIDFTLPAEAVVTLAVYDLEGRRVAALLDRAPESAGPHEVELNAQGLRAGCYWCRLTEGGVSLTRKMVVLR